MKEIDDALTKWVSLDDKERAIKQKKNDIEIFLMKSMEKYHWTDYTSEIDGVHVSLVTEEDYTIDESQLALLLTKSDLEKVKDHYSQKKLFVITQDAKKRLARILR